MVASLVALVDGIINLQIRKKMVHVTADTALEGALCGGLNVALEREP